MKPERQSEPEQQRTGPAGVEALTSAPGPWLPGAALSSERLLALQRAAGNQAAGRVLGRAAAASRRRSAEPAAEASRAGESVNKVGVVKYDGTPELRLRAKPSTSAKIEGNLSFGKRLQVISRHPGRWLFVSTELGNYGYVAEDYVTMSLPEPGARLYKVPEGMSAIGIAEKFYKAQAGDWGQDLRFYVAVLAKVNRISIPDETNAWKQVRFQAGRMIWIPTVEFARGLEDRVPSGSRSHELAERIGIADELDRIEELMRDFRRAVELSKRELPNAIRRHVDGALRDIVEALVGMLVAAIGILAVTTAVGAAVSGGTGAAIGFEVGMKFLEWLGLAFILAWVADAMKDVGGAFGKFVSKVWHARGSQEELERGAELFADAVGLMVAKLLEGVTMYAAARGTGAALNALKDSRMGKALGGRLNEWVKSKNAKPGERQQPVPTPPPGGSHFRSPAKRHYATKVDQKTVAKNKNTVIEPGVNVNADVAAINAGRATRVRDEYHVNDRVYGQHDGTLFPIRGNGFHELNRGAFRALGVYNKFGNTFEAEKILNAMGTEQAERDAALAVWKALNP